MEGDVDADVLAAKKARRGGRAWGISNGAKETRTPDPLHAMQVLYQLSYGPVGCE